MSQKVVALLQEVAFSKLHLSRPSSDSVVDSGTTISLSEIRSRVLHAAEDRRHARRKEKFIHRNYLMHCVRQAWRLHVGEEEEKRSISKIIFH